MHKRKRLILSGPSVKGDNMEKVDNFCNNRDAKPFSKLPPKSLNGRAVMHVSVDHANLYAGLMAAAQKVFVDQYKAVEVDDIIYLSI